MAMRGFADRTVKLCYILLQSVLFPDGTKYIPQNYNTYRYPFKSEYDVSENYRHVFQHLTK